MRWERAKKEQLESKIACEILGDDEHDVSEGVARVNQRWSIVIGSQNMSHCPGSTTIGVGLIIN